MKKIIALSLGALVVLASASCRRESTTPEEAREALRAPVTVTASMDGYQVKATDVSFEDGDAIGVFALDPFDRINVRGTVTGSSVNLATPFNWELVNRALFLGCYPYDANLKSVNWTFSVRTDQRSYEEYNKSDLRSAKTLTDHGSTVNLVFQHRLSKLTVNAVCEDKSDEVTAVTLGDLVIEAKVDLAAPSVETGTNRADIKAGKATSANGNTGFVAILVPQELTKLPLTVSTKSGQTLTFQPASPLKFEEGYAYKAEVTVPKG
ncbi:MAG: fimbrillin family protein, partial [Bacteroidota bacterium]|nr:fimbrillin family protein [Bacteroidota bacterium]